MSFITAGKFIRADISESVINDAKKFMPGDGHMNAERVSLYSNENIYLMLLSAMKLIWAVSKRNTCNHITFESFS